MKLINLNPLEETNNSTFDIFNMDTRGLSLWVRLQKLINLQITIWRKAGLNGRPPSF